MNSGFPNMPEPKANRVWVRNAESCNSETSETSTGPKVELWNLAGNCKLLTLDIALNDCSWNRQTAVINWIQSHEFFHFTTVSLNSEIAGPDRR